MLQYTCDWCKRQKKPDENWILGLAAERSYSSGHRREVSFASRWTEEWARHALAVHFCSAEHKNNYVEVLIGGARLLRQRTQKLRPASASAAAPAATTADVAQAPSTPRRRSTRRHAEPLAPEFTEADSVRAHALGVYLPQRGQAGGREAVERKTSELAGAKRQHSATIAGKPRRVQ